MANMRDVAALAGVAVSTVAAVFNGTKYVSPKLEQRVRSAAEQLGYKGSSERAKPGPDKEVGVILPGLYSAFFPPLLSGIGDAAVAFGHTVLLFDSNRSLSTERALMEKLVRRGTRHIILDSICDLAREQEYLDDLTRRLLGDLDLCVVMLEREVKRDAFHSVFVDNHQAAYDAVKHLIDLGRRQIAHIGGFSLFPHSHVRAQAYRAALLDHGLSCEDYRMLQGDFSPLSGYAAMNEFLDKGVRLDAVFCANDQMAIGAMKAIKTRGLRIPDDIAIVGFDNLPIASIVDPGLTTVEYPIYHMGFQAMQMIEDHARGAERERRRKQTAWLLVRRSTVPAQSEDWNLQRW